MPTTRKNVSDYLRMAGWALLFLLIAAIVIFLIPANIFFWRKLFIADDDSKIGLIVLGISLIFLAYEAYRFIKRKENPWKSVAAIFIFLIPACVLFWAVWFIARYDSKIGLIVLGILLIFLAYEAYKAYRFIKRMESPWKTFKGNLKKNLIILFFFAFTIYACVVLFVTLFPTEYGRCDFYNAPTTLNAGIREINGTTYKVQVCGTAGNDQDGTDDELELQLFSKEGELLAKRHYSVNWYASSGYHEPLQYNKDSITYTDSHQNEGKISVPPTKIDWIRARILLLD